MIGRPFHVALLLAFLAVHALGVARYTAGRVLCINPGGAAIEATTATGACICDDEDAAPRTPETADPVLMAFLTGDCLDLAMPANVVLSVERAGSVTAKIIALPMPVLDLFAFKSAVEPPEIARPHRRGALRARAPSSAGDLARLRTIILLT